MNKHAILLASLALCATARAEWFQVKSVDGYNRITAARPNEPANEVKIRIKNLENIEDIQFDKSKVLLSGNSAQTLAKDLLEDQLVWIENLEEDSGIFTGNIFLSYEQVIRGFSKQRMVGPQTTSPEIKKKLQQVCKTMLKNLNSTDTPDDAAAAKIANHQAMFIQSKSRNASWNINNGDTSLHFNSSEGVSPFTYNDCYVREYLKGIFVYEALYWFKYQGQFLPEDVQEIYVSWLLQYQSANPQAGKVIEQKIRDMTVRYDLYKDFIFDN